MADEERKLSVRFQFLDSPTELRLGKPEGQVESTEHAFLVTAGFLM